jgi:hypothetical protein
MTVFTRLFELRAEGSRLFIGRHGVITPSSWASKSGTLKSYVTMKSLHVLIVSALFLGLPCLPVFGADKGNGHDLLHLDFHTKMHNEGVISSATGDADLHYDQHGGKNAHEDLHVHVHGLAAGADYALSTQDNLSNVVQLAAFTTDEHGNADLHFRDKGPKHPHDHTGHVDGTLPDQLQPPTVIAGLMITDTDGVPILTADLSASQKFHYQTKRDLSNGSIRGKLQIKADAHHGILKLDVHGLDASASYSLAVNGEVVTSASADQHGHLHLRSQFENSTDVLSLSTVELLDSTSTAVLSASFP